MNQLIWDRRYLELGKNIAMWSEDNSQKLGVVITIDNRIIATGYNGFPSGVIAKAERFERPTKYVYTEHAERNAIYSAAKLGISLNDATLYMYSPQVGPPCGDCARAVIQSGITRVVTVLGPEPEYSKLEGWRKTMADSTSMFNEACIAWDQINL